MAGFLNAFNKSFQMPDDPQEVDANEQRRYAKMAQEDLTNTGGVRWDVASEGIVGDINSANEVDRRRLLMGTKVPSVAADGSIVEFDVSNVMREEDGSWVVGLKNPQTGEDTIITDTSNADPNGRVTKFTTEQINNAIANKYKALATLSGGNDRILSGQIGTDLVSLSRDSRKTKLDNEQRRRAADAESVRQGNNITTAINNAPNVDTARGAMISAPGQLENYLKNNMTPRVGSAEDQAANSLFPERPGAQEQLRQDAPPPVAAPPESAIDLDMANEQEAAFLAEGPVYNVDVIPTPGVSVGTDYLTTTSAGGKQVIGEKKAAALYPELAGTDFAVKSGRINSTISNAIKGAEYVRALRKNGITVDLENNSFINEHWDVIGENVSEFQQRDKERKLPAGTTLSLVQGFADTFKQQADDLDTSKFRPGLGRQGSITAAKNKIQDPNKAITAAVTSQASLDEVDSLDDNNTTRQTLVDPAYLPSLKKDQDNTGSLTDALNTDAVKKVVSSDGSLNEDAAKAVIEQGREVAEKEGFNSAEALANVDRSLPNDVKVQRAITAAALAASIQTNANGTNTFDQSLYNTLFNSNWNTYTTGDPNTSLKDVYTAKGTKAKDYITNYRNDVATLIGDVETTLKEADVNLLKTQQVNKEGLLFLISKSKLGTAGLEDESVAAIASFRSNANSTLENLRKLSDRINLRDPNLPGYEPYQMAQVKRMQEQAVRNVFLSAMMGQDFGGLAAWIESWGTENADINSFTDLSNFRVVNSTNGEISQNTKIELLNAAGEPTDEVITIKDLQNMTNKKTAPLIISTLFRFQNPDRAR